MNNWRNCKYTQEKYSALLHRHADTREKFASKCFDLLKAKDGNLIHSLWLQLSGSNRICWRMVRLSAPKSNAQYGDCSPFLSGTGQKWRTTICAKFYRVKIDSMIGSFQGKCLVCLSAAKPFRASVTCFWSYFPAAIVEESKKDPNSLVPY